MGYVYKLTATRDVGSNVGQNKKIPKGAVLQVVSSCTSHPSAKEISQAIKVQLGLDIPDGYCSSGNFKVEQMKQKPMRDLFCNECGLSYDIPHLVAERLLGVEYLHRIENRYEQMRKCYNCTCAEWQGVFTEDLKPFGGYDDTTSVTIPIGNSQLGADIKTLHKGAIGVDLSTWFNVQDNKHIMIVAQDPLRNNKYYGECYDAVISSPFGLHSLEHRQNARGGKMMDLLVKRLVANGYGIYLTDANKFFIYDHKTTDEFSDAHIDKYAEIIRQEIEIVKPTVIVCLGRSAERMCKKMGLRNILALPHLSGTARGAIVRKFSRLEEVGATAENIAEEYAREIMRSL